MPIIQSPASASPNPPVITTFGAGSGSWSPAQPTGLKWIRVKGAGAGGGGGAGATGANSRAVGAGGGAGGYFEHVFPASQLSIPEPYTVGAGGSQGPSGGVNPGGNGGSTTFKGFTAGGGVGGQGMTAYTGTIISTSQGGGGGNIGGSPSISATGGAGTWGACASTYVIAAGQGGASAITPAGGIRTTAPQDGINGRAGGSGGGGGAGGPSGAGLGGLGGDGILIIEEYY